MINNKLFKNKTILVTGHTGFKGSWLSAWLHFLGAKVVGVALEPPSQPSHFDAAGLDNILQDNRIDIQDANAITRLICEIKPDFVFHLAAQALVRHSYIKPVETMTTNAIGCVNVLEGLRKLDNKVAAVIITSDKAYENVEWVWGYRETDRLGGKDPYSASKGMAELAIRSYIESFFNLPESNVSVGITRAGNVIGGGDWAEDRIIPDCVRAWSENTAVDIRAPYATRPWQHILDPLSGYLLLAEKLYLDKAFHGEAYNFGPSAQNNHSVRELIEEMARYWDQVNWNDISINCEHVHEARLLKLNCDKALFDLNWQATLQFEESVKMTVEWYKHFYQKRNPSIYDFTMSQIEEYSDLAKLRHQRFVNND
jgi:CDP-glucose 4,6-dehydratase